MQKQKPVEPSSQIQEEYEKILKVQTDFSKKVDAIVKKSTSNLDYTKDINLLFKDRIFNDHAPYQQFFVLKNLVE